ncbi:hypothetical protein evm_013925 [Chilo suppressalis]|nr:hypothetical protein evm_013925 [Chilo suppressalis]
MKNARERHTTQISAQRRDPLPPTLREKLAKKKKLKQLWTISRCPRVKTELNRTTAEVSAEVKKWRGDSWSTTIEKASDSNPSLHRLLRALTRQRQTTCPLLDEQGRARFSALDRANIFAANLKTQFSPHEAAQEATEHHQMVEMETRRFLDSPAPQLPGDCFISPSEVRKSAIRLNPRKAPGPDNLPTTALAELPKRATAAWAQIFNAMLRSHHFPTAWKKGRVVMIPKPGKDRRQPTSYRPITLLDHIGKLFERLLLNRLQPLFTPRAEQFGFRSGHSTVLQLTRLLHHMADNHNRGNCTVAVFLDIEKAFDRVWHPGLIYKLTKTNIHPALIKLIASYLQHRTFFVTVEATESITCPIEAGVPQGSVISPFLYSLYTNDMTTINDNLKQWENKIELALFADDSAFYTSAAWPRAAAIRMQKQLDRLPEWLAKWRVAVNVTKTTAICTTLKRPPPKLTLKGKPIDWASSITYLGIKIDKGLRLNAQAEAAITKSRGARAALRPVLKSNLPLRTKTQKTRLQQQQNVALRIITQAQRYVLNEVIARDLKMESIEDFPPFPLILLAPQIPGDENQHRDHHLAACSRRLPVLTLPQSGLPHLPNPNNNSVPHLPGPPPRGSHPARQTALRAALQDSRREQKTNIRRPTPRGRTPARSSPGNEEILRTRTCQQKTEDHGHWTIPYLPLFRRKRGRPLGKNRPAIPATKQLEVLVTALTFLRSRMAEPPRPEPSEMSSLNRRLEAQIAEAESRLAALGVPLPELEEDNATSQNIEQRKRAASPLAWYAAKRVKPSTQMEDDNADK